MPKITDAVKGSTLLRNTNDSKTNNPNTTKIDNVSNTLIQPNIQLKESTFTDDAKLALPETSAFKNRLEDLPSKNRAFLAECTKSGLINDKNKKIDVFFEAIRNETSSTLIHKLKNCTIPKKLSLDSNKKLFTLLTQYNPDTLTTSPLIDVQGKPVEIETIGHCWVYAGMDDSKEFFFNDDVIKIIDDYQSHKKWTQSNLCVRTIKEEDVPAHESVLIGQEGVFALNDIKSNTTVFLFGGMLLDEKIDIENDEKIRKLVDCDKYYNRKASCNDDNSCVIEAMDISMKMNTATEKGKYGISHDPERNNLRCFNVRVKRSSDQKPLQIMAFFSVRDIKSGEQLCFNYDINAQR